ncbi:MAG: C2 family cysteine protease, partial [Terriglobales bacterium]
EALAKKEAAESSSKAKETPLAAKSKGRRAGDRVFTAAEIAKDGASGIDQMFYPNCWFESSMSALAMLPRGQRLMADLVRYGGKEGTYVIRFPGDGNEYTISEEQLEKSGIHDKALWATLIEAGQTLKFPNDDGGLLSDGLGCLTGQHAETVSPAGASEQELSSFIDGAVKSQNPIVCGSQYASGLPRLVVPGHAYTIIGFEPASGMIKIRNPHGVNSERFALRNDSTHHYFEQFDDGVFKIHLSLFRMYFSQVARAFI